MTSSQRLNSRISRIFRPVDYASLAMMRILFGVIMCWEVYRYFSKGWIPRYFINPTFHFKYLGFGWVHPWSGDGMYWHFALLGILAFMIMTGMFYRLASILFVFAFSYVFLLDKALYLNHFYMVIIMSFLLAIAPANRNWSVDALLFKRIRANSIPVWSIWIFKIQMEIIYLYAGIVKLNMDWLRGQPLNMWLPKVSHYPILGDMVTVSWIPLVSGYFVILLHLIGPPLLLFRRTRLPILILYACFHFLNAWIFNIGIFPWMTLAATFIFFEPDWPRQVFHNFKRLFMKRKPYVHVTHPSSSILIPLSARQLLMVSFLGLWISYQVLFPLRHILYPGNVSWTEEGHNFSWQMKLRDKKSTQCVFQVVDRAHDKEWRVNPSQYLRYRQASKMCKRPDLILQFAKYLAKTFEKHGYSGVAVYARSMVSLNGRKFAPMIDENQDLTMKKREIWPPADWILPLKEPFARHS